MKTELISTLFLSLIGIVSTCQAEQKTWKDAKSERTIQAELLTSDGETVTLKKTDGITVEINLERLSKEDRDFVLQNVKTGLGINSVHLSGETTNVLNRHNAVPPVKEGLYVLEVLPNTPASKSGLQVGDIIATVEGKPVRDGSFGYLDPAKEYGIVAYRPVERKTTAAAKPSKTPTKTN